MDTKAITLIFQARSQNFSKRGCNKFFFSGKLITQVMIHSSGN